MPFLWLLEPVSSQLYFLCEFGHGIFNFFEIPWMNPFAKRSFLFFSFSFRNRFYIPPHWWQILLNISNGIFLLDFPIYMYVPEFSIFLWKYKHKRKEQNICFMKFKERNRCLLIDTAWNHAVIADRYCMKERHTKPFPVHALSNQL